MKKLRILIDVDGIVANTLPYWLAKIAEATATRTDKGRLPGVIAQVADIKVWDLSKCPPLDKVDPKLMFGMLNNSYFMINVPVMFGAKEAIQQLVDDGHELVFVTARTGATSMGETLEWFHKHFPKVNTEKQLAFMYDKQYMIGDVLIDDKGATLEAYKAKHPEALTIGIRYPYNEYLGPEHKMFGDKTYLDATLTWGSIYACIKGHAEAPEPLPTIKLAKLFPQPFVYDPDRKF